MTLQRIGLLTTGLLLAGIGVAQEPAQPSAPAGEAIPAGVDNRTYKIGPQDVLRISVFRSPELTGIYSVEPDGMISLHLIDHPVKAEGLTPEQLRDKLTEDWKVQVNSPEVTVAVIEVKSKMYRVNGMVNRPGTFPLVRPIRVYEALADAGGFREWANEKKVLIIRGEKERLTFNAKDYRNGKNLDKNILIEPGDIIEVR